MQAINLWIEALRHYSDKELLLQPSKDEWSIGQVYVHLLGDTRFYIEQIILCTSSNNNADKEANANGRLFLDNNSFPNKKLENPFNANMPQPVSKEQLEKEMLQLKKDLDAATATILSANHKGKTKHPGLGYFNAPEWLQFADMHFRHHLRQKEKIDTFLGRK